jgi:hypothetical protein
MLPSSGTVTVHLPSVSQLHSITTFHALSLFPRILVPLPTSLLHFWLHFCTSDLTSAPLTSILHLWLHFCTSDFTSAPLTSLLQFWPHFWTLFYICLVYRLGDTESKSSFFRCHENNSSVAVKTNVDLTVVRKTTSPLCRKRLCTLLRRRLFRSRYVAMDPHVTISNSEEFVSYCFDFIEICGQNIRCKVYNWYKQICR